MREMRGRLKRKRDLRGINGSGGILREWGSWEEEREFCGGEGVEMGRVRWEMRDEKSWNRVESERVEREWESL